MSYNEILKNREKQSYRVVPEAPYKVIRYCGGCNCKATYISTGEFRVNANGNKIDVWLIYQCEKCKHTYNLSIYERVRPDEIKDEYDQFLANDAALAFQYGINKQLFTKNRAEINLKEESYSVECLNEENEETESNMNGEKTIVIENPYHLRIRPDKIAAQILGMPRGKIKLLEQEKKIQFEKNLPAEIIKIKLLNGYSHMD